MDAVDDDAWPWGGVCSADADAQQALHTEVNEPDLARCSRDYDGTFENSCGSILGLAHVYADSFTQLDLSDPVHAP